MSNIMGHGQTSRHSKTREELLMGQMAHSFAGVKKTLIKKEDILGSSSSTDQNETNNILLLPPCPESSLSGDKADGTATSPNDGPMEGSLIDAAAN